MKKLMFFAMLLMSLPAISQSIPNGSMWFDGVAQYTADVRAGGKFVYFHGGTPHEGGFEFTLERKSQGIYELIPSRQAEDYTPVGEFGWKVELTTCEGTKALIVRNAKGNACQILAQTELTCEENHVRDNVSLLEGTYSEEQIGFLGNGCTHMLDAKGCRMGTAEKYVPYEFMEEYDFPVNVIKAGGKLWMLVPTVLGMNVYPAQFTDDDVYTKAGEATPVFWSDHSAGRFIIASRRLLNTGLLAQYSREALRLMRNEILARHGYTFQSEDLADYFLKQSWYNPLPSNDNINLSDIEKINISLIQAEEAKADDERFPNMEEN